MTMARSRYLFPVLLLGLVSQISCGGLGQQVEISFQNPAGPGTSKDNPLAIPSTAGDSVSLTFGLDAVGDFTGLASIIIFATNPCAGDSSKECLTVKDANGTDREIETDYFPPRPYEFTDTKTSFNILVTFSPVADIASPPDGNFRIKVSAGAVGELANTGVDLYFTVVP